MLAASFKDHGTHRSVYGESKIATALKVLLLVALSTLWSAAGMGIAFRMAIAT